MPRSTRPLLALVLGALLAGLTTALPAQAQSYRYWGYYTLDGTTWTFAQTGPSESQPADGSLEGWRFAVTTESSNRVPRATPDVETLCAGVDVPEGSKAVGVVLDYGTAQDAPDGETPPAARGACAVVPADATGSDVLAAVAQVRVGDGGFVCGVDGYPSTGCGDQVEATPPAGDEQQVALELPDQTTTSTSTSWLPVGLGLAVVALLAAVGVWLARRRGRADDGASG